MNIVDDVELASRTRRLRDNYRRQQALDEERAQVANEIAEDEGVVRAIWKTFEDAYTAQLIERQSTWWREFMQAELPKG